MTTTASTVTDRAHWTAPSRRSSSISSSISLLSPPQSIGQLSEDFSDERIVWSGSNSCVLVSHSAIPPAADDDDFILLSPTNNSSPKLREMSHTTDAPSGGRHSRGPSSVSSSSIEALMPAMEGLTIGSRSSSPGTASNRSAQKSRRRRKANKKPSPSVTIPKPSPPQVSNKKKVAASPKARVSDGANRISVKSVGTTDPRAVVATRLEDSLGLGERPIVDDVSECGVEYSLYEDAVRFMGLVISSPDAVAPSSRLEILQALIIELGLVTSEVALPSSITAARSFLRSHVFVNILDYLVAREKGKEALQQIMHKNRTALVKDLRKKRKGRASLTWVKETGLSALLVSCY